LKDVKLKPKMIMKLPTLPQHFPRMAAAGLAAILLGAGCGGMSTSSGLMLPGEGASPFPAQVPRKVLVAPFGGDATVSRMAGERFAAGLTALGFDVAEPTANALLKSETPPNYDGTLSDTLVARLTQAGLEGVFLGRITVKTQRSRVRAEAAVKLLRLEDRGTIWRGECEDPRYLSWDLTPDRSVGRAVDRVLKMLRGDLKKSAKLHK
jgi:hypothetical protein